MHRFDLAAEASFSDRARVETILLDETGGDFSVACWEPGQIGPYHCHPEAVEAYLCVSGGGTMQTPTESVPVTPGSLVVHPMGELHEYENGSERSILFRVRYGADVVAFEWARRGDPTWSQSDGDAAYFARHPVARP